MEPPDSTNKRAASPRPEKETDEAANKRQAVHDPDTGEPSTKPAGATEDGEESAAAAVTSSLDTETVVVRAIIHSKHTGTIIGKGGSTISWIRSQSQAKIMISDADRSGQVDERITTVTGTCAAVFRAFSFICEKIRESQQLATPNNPNPPADAANVVMRLAIPHIQAGGIIGKKGAKIKEIRDATHANISVESEMLPNSTERCCIVSGSVESVAQSIFHIACTLLQVHVKGQNTPYVPGAGRMGFGGPAGGFGGPPNPYGGYGAPPAPAGFVGNAAGFVAHQVQQSLNVANDIVGAIIGKQGSRINEIRTTSRANIKIADKVPGAVERTIIMSGTPDAVHMAQYLIQTRMQEAMMAQMTGGQAS